VVILLAQVGLAPLIEVQGARPDLLLVFVLFVTARNGRYAGLAAGFLAGLAQDIISLNFIGVMALTKSSVAFWIGFWFDKRERTVPPLAWLVLTAAAAAVQDIVAALFILQGIQVDFGGYLIRTILPATVYTGIVGFIAAMAPFGLRQRQPRTQAPLKPRRLFK